MGIWNSDTRRDRAAIAAAVAAMPIQTLERVATVEPREHRTAMAPQQVDQGNSIVAAAGQVARQHLMGAARSMDGPSSAVIGGKGYTFEWSHEADMYDQFGPGFVGSYLDLISGRVANAGPRLEDLHQQPVHDKQLLSIWKGVWSTFVGPYSTGKDLVERMARLRAKKGECFILELDDGKFAVCHPNELDWSKNGFARWLDPVTERYTYVPIEGGRVWRSWSQLDLDPRMPQSDLERALPHIREYINVKLRQDADVTSPLVRNKLIRFGPDTELYDNEDDDADPFNGMPDAFVDYINLAKRQDNQRYHHKRKGVDNVPFPMVGDDLEVIDMARTSDPYTSDLEDKAVNAFARAVRVPIQYIHAGPGTAKFANEGYVSDALIDDAVVPLGDPVFQDLWRITMKKRMAIAMVGVMGIKFEEAWSQLNRLTIVTNDDLIRPEVNKVEDVVNGYQAGAATRQDVADVLGTQLLDIPPDVSEYVFWQIARTTRQTTAPTKNPVEAAREDALAQADDAAQAAGGDGVPPSEQLAETEAEMLARQLPDVDPIAAALGEAPKAMQLISECRNKILDMATNVVLTELKATPAITAGPAALPAPSAAYLVDPSSPVFLNLALELTQLGITAGAAVEITRRERERAMAVVPNEACRTAEAAMGFVRSERREDQLNEAARKAARTVQSGHPLKERMATAVTASAKLAMITESDIRSHPELGKILASVEL